MARIITRPSAAPARRSIIATSTVNTVGQVYRQPFETKSVVAASHARETLVSSITHAVASDCGDTDRFPFRVLELGTDRDVTDGHWLGRALNNTAAPWLSSSQLRAAISLNLDYTGEAYFVVIGETILPLLSGKVDILAAKPGSRLRDGTPTLVAGYVVRNDNGIEIGRYDADGRPVSGQAEGVLLRVHYQWPGDPYRADAPVIRAAGPINVAHASRAATEAVLRNAGHPAGVVSIDDDSVTQDELEAFERRINSRFGDVTQRGRVMAVNARTTLSPFQDAGPGEGWTRLADQAREDILSVWAMPPSRLGRGGARTYENQRVELAAYYQQTVMPRLQMLAAAINRVASITGVRVQVEGAARELAEQDNEVAQRAVALFQAGIISQDEARDLVGFDAAVTITPPQPQAPPAPEADAAPLAEAGRQTRATQPSLAGFDRAFDRLVDEGEDEFARFAQRFHERLYRQVAGALNRRSAAGIETRVEPGDIIDVEGRNRELLDDLPGLLEPIAAAVRGMVAGQLAIEGIPAAPVFDVILANRMQRLVNGGGQYKGWTQQIVDDLTLTMRAGYAAGESIEDIKARVASSLGVQPGQSGNIGARATRIARTEVIGTANEVTQASYKASGVVKAKRWNASGDARMRDSHAAADGQEVPLDGLFNVGGVMLAHPGDPNGPAAEVINCRCRTLPVVDPSYL